MYCKRRTTLLISFTVRSAFCVSLMTGVEGNRRQQPPQSIRLWSSLILSLPSSSWERVCTLPCPHPTEHGLQEERGLCQQVCLLHKADPTHPELWWRPAAGLPRQNHRAVVRKRPTWEEPPTAASSSCLWWRLCGSGQVMVMSLGTLFLYPETRTSATASLYLLTHVLNHSCCHETQGH